MGQRYETTANTQPPIQKNRAFDPLTHRHLFRSIEADFEGLFSRKLARLEHLEKQLGADNFFTLDPAEQSRIHRQYSALEAELRLLYAFRGCLETVTESAIEAQKILSAEYFQVVAERDYWKTAFDNYVFMCDNFYIPNPNLLKIGEK